MDNFEIDTQIKKMISGLYDLFDIFNEHYYNKKLEKPVILVQTNGREHRAMGWCTNAKIWKNEDKGTFHYEINLSAEFLYRDVDEICSTLLHEMVHLHCRYENIKETSRGTMYHNKKFKSIAEEHGIIIDYDKQIGFSPSKINDETKKLIEKYIKENPFIFTRKNHKGNEPIEIVINNMVGIEDKPKKEMRMYYCPNCEDVSFRTSKELNLICGRCDSKLEVK